jgi:sigma-70-like protein
MLHDVLGCEHHEIAEMLGNSIGNSKSQLHKARLRLRKLLRTSSSDYLSRKKRPRTTRLVQSLRNLRSACYAASPCRTTILDGEE